MTALVLSLLLPLVTQTPKEPAHDLFMHTERVPGVELRFVDYHWQPALFAAMERGSTDEPLATRNWVVARLVLQTRPLTLEGKRLPVGNYAVALWPNADGKGMTVEVRTLDMREVLPNLNAIAPLPKGETLYRGPARFEDRDACRGADELRAGRGRRRGRGDAALRRPQPEARPHALRRPRSPRRSRAPCPQVGRTARMSALSSAAGR